MPLQGLQRPYWDGKPAKQCETGVAELCVNPVGRGSARSASSSARRDATRWWGSGPAM